MAMNRFQLQEKMNYILDHSFELDNESRLKEYKELFEDYEKKLITDECLTEELLERLGEEEFISLCDEVEAECNKISSFEHGDIIKKDVTSEQEQLLDDLF